MATKRPGAFSANFKPEVLEEFRNYCHGHGLQYSRILEKLAMLYLETDGECLEGYELKQCLLRGDSQRKVPYSDFMELVQRVARLESSKEWQWTPEQVTHGDR